MKKVLVINAIKSFRDASCCNIFKRVNWFKCMVSSKIKEENELSAELNAIAGQGYELEDEKVLPHNLYVENKFVEQSVHGVFRFKKTNFSPKYRVYFGPIIEVTPASDGCGCGCKNLGCSGFSCKNILSCRSKGGDIQYLNFLNDEKNQKPVQVLNNHFGLRKSFTVENDYVYYATSVTSVNELVKEHYDRILQQYTKDVEEIYQQGMGFIRNIDTPSYEDTFTQAMLFGSTSLRRAKMADMSAFSSNVTLSRFDVWYFPVVKGLIRRIIEYVPILNFFLRKKDIILPTPTINDENIELLESIYENDFVNQIDNEFTGRAAEQLVIGKIPVTIAIKRKMGFWAKLIKDVEYDFHTYEIDATEG